MNQDEEVDISTEVGYEPAKIPDQIAGKWFPDTPVKSGTRWFYVLLLMIVLGYIGLQIFNAIEIVIAWMK